MRIPLPTLLLAALSLAGTSCQKQNDPAPYVAPAPVYDLYSIVHYPASNETSGTNYSALRLTGEAKQESGRVVLRFGTGAEGRERVEFMMPGSFTPGKPSSFGYQSLPAPAADAVQVTYLLNYTLNPTTQITKTYRADKNLTEGSLVITAYDAVHRLVSGRYEVTFQDVADPYAELSPNQPARKAKVIVGGEFSNLPIKP
ncbi:hypothetical protein D0N36_04985 [Hymenobacter lapidiphilus]|uniref:hypothetical protein n=1 Tax=Hymenobacter sp. CCM 8763 TaxID=2303334 RepID=UPI000E34A48F|nr:hypothetical protein [Hymenobacter sp. CCM 8763]RFP66081.1 hypothetical protein D0N36_04985 [Hymenobacter sp. CCM 8763]